MTCDLKNRNQIIIDYLTDELSEPEMLAFEQHYFQCKSCFEELKLCERTVTLIRDEGKTVFLRSAEPWFNSFETFLKNLKWKSEKVRFSWRHAVAFGAVILFLAISLPIAIRQYKKDLEQKKITVTAENFKPCSKFDNLMEQIYQSSMVLIHVRPHNDANFENEILFQWEIEKDDLAYEGLVELKIYDNKENTLLRFSVKNIQFQLTEALAPGLYYWSLITDDEMAHLGRFYVRRP